MKNYRAVFKAGEKMIVAFKYYVRGLGVKKHDTGFVAVQTSSTRSLREAYVKNNRVF